MEQGDITGMWLPISPCLDQYSALSGLHDSGSP